MSRVQEVSRTFYPYQQKAFEYAMRTRHPALFMEMRLGKTLVTIRSVWDRSLIPALVVAPLSVLPVWEDELAQEGHDDVLVLRHKRQLCMVPDEYNWYITNYEFIRSHPGLGAMDWGAVILDESTRIKNPRAQTTKLLCKSFRRAQARFLLSGLPAPEDPMEFFPQFEFQTGGFLGFRNYWQFRQHMFYQTGYGGYEWAPRRGTVKAIKEEVHKRAFCLTRKEAGIGSPKVYERRVVQPTREQIRLQKKALKEYALDEKQTNWTPVVQTWLAQIAGGFAEGINVGADNKCSELQQLLNGELKGQQVVVFFRFNQELEHCLNKLRWYQIKCEALTGATSESSRHFLADQFQLGNIRALLCQIKIARFGLNFSAASTAIYYSNSYALEDRVQSEDRILHPSKSEPLLYIDLVTKGSLDEDVVQALRSKRNEARFFTNKIYQLLMERTRNARRIDD